MADDVDPSKLQAALAALVTERDTAVSALEYHQRDADEQTRLLVEEQDRFVSRLLEAHEREVGRLRLELEEATTTALRLEQKHDRDRVASARLEENLARAQVDLDRMREQRDAARAETRRAQQVYVSAQASIEHLQGELAMARSMLADMMADETEPTFRSVQPTPSAHEASRPPRESGIVNRRPPRPRSTPPGTNRAREGHRDTPRALAANANTKESTPPSSR